MLGQEAEDLQLSMAAVTLYLVQHEGLCRDRIFLLSCGFALKLKLQLRKGKIEEIQMGKGGRKSYSLRRCLTDLRKNRENQNIFRCLLFQGNTLVWSCRYSVGRRRWDNDTEGFIACNWPAVG